MKRKHLTNMILTALFAALIYGVTMISVPVGGFGYIHVGDSLIYLAVTLLSLPYAVFAAALGAGLADFTLGYAIYIIPTVIIKSLVAASAKGASKLSKKEMVKPFLICLAGIITILGYYVADTVIMTMSGSSLAAAATASSASLLINSIQAAASAVVFILISTIKKVSIKK